MNMFDQLSQIDLSGVVRQLTDAGFSDEDVKDLLVGSRGPSRHVKNQPDDQQPQPTPTLTRIPRQKIGDPIVRNIGNPQFDCSNGATGANKLAAIDREPVIIRASAQSVEGGVFTASFPSQSNAEQMYLCEVEAEIQLGINEVAPASQAVQDAYRKDVERLTRVTLTFRDEDVSGFKFVRLAELVWNPECCTTGKCIGALLPEHGALQIEFENIPSPPAGIDLVAINTDVWANGCGCDCSSKKSCCC